MKRVDGGLLLEPGEMELLAGAASDRAARAVSPSELAGAIVLRQFAAVLTEFVAGPAPPVYVLAPASRSVIRKLARWLAS